ncbi:MAG TPA: hypothetical protein VKP65_00215 [Rhodothermales bacterium]|nr:hypothetical protein [Rhodothermales bacterium]
MTRQKYAAFSVSFLIGLVLYFPFVWIPTHMQAAQVPDLLVILILVALLFLAGLAAAKVRSSSGLALALGVLVAYTIAGIFTETITPWWMIATRIILAAALVYAGHAMGRLGSTRAKMSASSS